MAARLTDRQKKKILADYVQLGSYNATAKVNGCSLNTVKKFVQENADIAELCNQKKKKTRRTSWHTWKTRKMWCAKSSANVWRF